MRTCTYIHTYVRAYIHTYVCMYVCTYVLMYVCMYVYCAGTLYSDIVEAHGYVVTTGE